MARAVQLSCHKLEKGPDRIIQDATWTSDAVTPVNIVNQFDTPQQSDGTQIKGHTNASGIYV
jgi:hypothetical protein